MFRGEETPVPGTRVFDLTCQVFSRPPDAKPPEPNAMKNGKIGIVIHGRYYAFRSRARILSVTGAVCPSGPVAMRSMSPT